MSLTQHADALSTRHLDADLKGHTVRSTAVTLTAQVLKFGMQLVSIVVLARLLTPADFGLVAMVTVLTMLLGPLQDGGLSMATVQRQDITHAQVSNLFWLNALLGLSLCLLMVLAAPVIAAIYGEPRLTSIAIVMSLAFVVGGLSVQLTAVLKRQMRFKALAVVDVVALAAGTVAAIVLAAMDFGYWALVAGPLVSTLIVTLMVWRLGDWRPSWICRGAGTKPLVSFGLHLTGANVFWQLSVHVVPFAIGLVGGPKILGYFNRANTLISVPFTQLIPPVIAVFQPALCRVSNNNERMRSAILGITGKILCITVLPTVFLFINAAPVVDLVLGEHWQEASEIAQILSIFVLTEPLAAMLAISLVASGNGAAMFRWNLFYFFITIASILLGSLWGVYGIIVGYVISAAIIKLPLFIFYSRKYLPITVSDIVRVYYPYFFLTVGLSITLSSLNMTVDDPTNARSLFFSIPTAIVVYALMGFMYPRVRKEIIDMVDIATSIIFRKTR